MDTVLAFLESSGTSPVIHDFAYIIGGGFEFFSQLVPSAPWHEFGILWRSLLYPAPIEKLAFSKCLVNVRKRDNRNLKSLLAFQKWRTVPKHKLTKHSLLNYYIPLSSPVLSTSLVQFYLKNINTTLLPSQLRTYSSYFLPSNVPINSSYICSLLTWTAVPWLCSI